MEKQRKPLKGWIVLVSDGKHTDAPKSLINGILRENQQTQLIPMFTTYEDAEMYAALLCSQNENIVDTTIASVASILNKSKNYMEVLMKDSRPKPSFLRRIKDLFKRS